MDTICDSVVCSSDDETDHCDQRLIGLQSVLETPDGKFTAVCNLRFPLVSTTITTTAQRLLPVFRSSSWT